MQWLTYSPPGGGYARPPPPWQQQQLCAHPYVQMQQAPSPAQQQRSQWQQQPQPQPPVAAFYPRAAAAAQQLPSALPNPYVPRGQGASFLQVRDIVPMYSYSQHGAAATQEPLQLADGTLAWPLQPGSLDPALAPLPEDYTHAGKEAGQAYLSAGEKQAGRGLGLGFKQPGRPGHGPPASGKENRPGPPNKVYGLQQQQQPHASQQQQQQRRALSPAMEHHRVRAESLRLLAVQLVARLPPTTATAISSRGVEQGGGGGRGAGQPGCAVGRGVSTQAC